MEFGPKTFDETWDEYCKNAPPWDSLPIEEKRRGLKWRAEQNRKDFPGIKPEIWYDQDGLRHESIGIPFGYRANDPSTYPVSASEKKQKDKKSSWSRLEKRQESGQEKRESYQIPDWVEEEDRKQKAKKQKGKAKANEKDSKKKTKSQEIPEKKKTELPKKKSEKEKELDSIIEKQRREIAELKKKLEEYELCQICYEPFDENLHAKYGHACGHGACKKCMKNEFSRQKEGLISKNLIVKKIFQAKKQKFYCHCGFQIHEKKIIRLFV